jgi:demethylmenaquinone methyltransferase/2-methoxy-6-polyprenyl-1,4-benzoquinol methylase
MTLTPPEVETAPDAHAKRSYVRDMFTAIAPRYDLLNHVLSLNVDRHWRRRAIDRLGWERAPEGTYLDLCAGTLDLAVELEGRSGFRGRVVGADFVLPMLSLGRAKGRDLRAVGADALDLPFGDASFDGLTIGFGIRNLTDIDAGLSEMARVLKPGARLVILEFATPTAWPIRPLYLWYFRRVLPQIGRFVSKHKSAYTYLPASVEEFPEPEALALRMRDAGFSDTGGERQTFGIAWVSWGTKS